MTSTPVSNDVSGVMLNMASQTVQKDRTENNFSDVLQKQSQPQKQEEVKPEKSQATSPTKVEKSAEGKIKEEASVKTEKPRTETLEETQEKVVENAEELVGQLLVQIAEELGMSMEEVENLLGEMGMQPTDLLSSENLMQFLVTAGGESDSLSLLTNEKLYETFQNLNRTLEEGLEEIQKLTGMDREEIVKMVEQTTDDAILLPNVELNATDEEDTTGKETVKTTVKPETDKEFTGTQEKITVVAEKGQSENAKGGETNLMNNGHNAFAQNLMNQQMVANLENVIPTESYFSADTEMIMNQIMDFMKVNVGDGLTQLEMQLHPESLGTLQIHLASKDGVITAQFTTENEVVKEVLENQMVQLKETFKEQGIKVEAIEVSVQTNRFDRNLEQGRQNQPGESNDAKPQTKVRRLNLKDLEDLETVELEEEERLAAEMMVENGSTVDYTA
ncbi:MAG: flagellar hook-length control protein FliK [Lachnospiraceae bacterium]|nr:flagellar hook-length control protein FliK [Lachnospiraceae bacterium]